MAENREFEQDQDQLNQKPEQAQQNEHKPETGEQMEQDGELQEDVETDGQGQPATGETQAGFVGGESESDRRDDLINRDLDDQK